MAENKTGQGEEKDVLTEIHDPIKQEADRGETGESFDKEIQDLSTDRRNFWTDSGNEESSDEEGEAAFYEARRKERHERAVQRRRKRNRNRFIAAILTALIVLGGAGYFLDDRIGISQGAETLVAKARELWAAREEAREKKKAEEQENTVAKSDGSAEGDASAENGIPAEGDDSTETDPAQNGSESGTASEPEVQIIPQAAAAGAGVIAAQSNRENTVLMQAENYVVQYDYDSAINLLQNDAAYARSTQMQQAAAQYQQTKDSCVSWSPEQVTHVFYHSLIVDTSKAFDGDYKEAGYNQMMTTLNEFNQITQTMYDRGYVMVNLYDLAKVNENGVMTAQEILLPEGKTPFVLSQDDVCYYHCQDGDGFATKLVIDAEGKIRNEYVEDDGSVSVGDYDVVPLIDRFVEAHPDFSYHGTKGIVALTGYNGILGYRTDISYQTRPDDLYADKLAWLEAHPDFDLETERAGAKTVADAMKAEGWTFASHTWGHKNMSDVSMERLITDTQNFKENVDPLIGGTDIIIFAFGADINKGQDYTGEEKFDYLKSQGYNYYCNVDSNQYFVQIRDSYFRMGRRNLDGYRMYYNPDLLTDLFDASAVFDPARPTPVPPMNGG
ncbi:polysaccharide deacetylase family protein [Ruminococcus sp. 5_1_39BFAA]|uniref:polysaccharide deacetylase family protein n=1 Tax=Ruminococcus sp. 5_1_39BFAA TaxID=457412 RepID=UPI00356A55B1